MHIILHFLATLIISILLFSCKGNSNDKSLISAKDTIHKILLTNNADSDKQVTDSSSIVAEDDLETYYLVVVDTSHNYYQLQRKMQVISQDYNIPIDTMGRYYNRKKDLIALPDDDEDEMYRGEYILRRSPSAHLSLEYLDFYDESFKEKTIALVSGIYESKHSADSALNILKNKESQVFILKAEVYIGCMH